MSVFPFAHLPRPENFHEIAWLRLIKVIEVLSKAQLVKETGGAWSICVPPAPDAFAIALISNDQLFQRSVVETQLASRA